MRSMVNKNIKRMLLFVTLCILLIGIVSAEDYVSDDSSIQTDTISNQITDTAESVSEVNDNEANDNNEDLIKDDKSVQSTKTATTKTKTKISIDYVPDISVDESVFIMGTLTDAYNNPLKYTTVKLDVNGDGYNTETDYYGDFFGEYFASKSGTKTITVSYAGNSNYEASSAKRTFTVTGQSTTYPEYTYITLNNIKEVSYGQYTTISGYYYYGNDIPLTQTNMRININGQTYTAKTDNKGYFAYNYKTTKDGSNTVTVSYSGNTNFQSATTTKTFNVKYVEPKYTYITLNNIQEVAYGGYTTITGYYYYGNNIPLTSTTMRLNINGKRVTAKTDKQGYFTYSYKTERVGKNTVTVSYPGNTNFKSATATKTFNVRITSPIYTYITLNTIKEVTNGQTTAISGYYYYGNNIPLIQTTMRLNINGKTYTAKTNDKGFFTYNYKTTKEGYNTVSVSYPGNTNFKSAETTKSFNIKSVGPQYTYIKVDNIADVSFDERVYIRGYYYYGNDIPLTYTPMAINFNGEKYTVKTDSNGYFSYYDWAEKVGKNTVTVSYHGNSNFKAATATKTFNVKITSPIYTYVSLNDVKEVTQGEYTTISGHYYYGYGMPLIQTTMRININGQTYTAKTDNNGYFTYNYKTTKDGSNSVTVSYPGNTNFQKTLTSTTFNVKSVGPQYTYIVLNNISDKSIGTHLYISGYYYYGNNIPLTNTPMTISINGKLFDTVKTDNNGFFSRGSFGVGKIGKNTVTVSYHGNSNFKAASSTKTFNYIISNPPLNTFISLNEVSDVTIGEYVTISGEYYHNVYSTSLAEEVRNGYWAGHLTFDYSYPLTQTTMRININGQTYTVKTDDNGYFSYNYKTTKLGTNTVIVSYPGNDNFGAASTTETFTVSQKLYTLELKTMKSSQLNENTVTYLESDPFYSIYETSDSGQYDKGVYVELDVRGLYDPPYRKIINATFYFKKNSDGKVYTITEDAIYDGTFVQTDYLTGYTPYKAIVYYTMRTDAERRAFNW